MRPDLMDYDDDEPKLPEENQGAHKPSRGELCTMALAAVLIVYGIVSKDVPVIFLMLGFLLVEARYFAEKYCGAMGKALSGVLKGFGLTMLIGAIFLMFLP